MAWHGGGAAPAVRELRALFPARGGGVDALVYNTACWCWWIFLLRVGCCWQAKRAGGTCGAELAVTNMSARRGSTVRPGRFGQVRGGGTRAGELCVCM
jgi:hypothetical protein